MSDSKAAIDSYLERLAEQLEALGPAESADVVAEVREHMDEALTDEGGSEGRVVERFGPAEALAARILEERGISPTGSGVLPAPWVLRAGALVADIAIWLAVLVVPATPVAVLLFFMPFSGARDVPMVALESIALLAAVVGVVWWRIASWRRPSHATLGMSLAGLRRIRIGASTRVVRGRDIPGTPSPRRLWPAIVLGAALITHAAVIFSVSQTFGADIQGRAQSAVHDASVGVSIVNDLYRAVLAGEDPVGSLGQSGSPAADAAIAALATRHASGALDSYLISSTELGDWKSRLSSWFSPPNDIVVYVTIDELDDTPGTTPVLCRWKVACHTEPQGAGAYGGEWVIDSAEIVPQ